MQMQADTEVTAVRPTAATWEHLLGMVSSMPSSGFKSMRIV